MDTFKMGEGKLCFTQHVVNLKFLSLEVVDGSVRAALIRD